MSDVTRILSQIEGGDPAAADQLLPLVYGELRKLAATKLAQEKSGNTLQATALVHDAYIRLVDVGKAQHWNSRGHFFGAAAEAMRRILVESARRRAQLKHGGDCQRVALDAFEIAIDIPPDQVLRLDEALSSLSDRDPIAAKLATLHCFAGLSIDQAGQALGISTRTAYRDWNFARAWLYREICSGETCSVRQLLN
jgi:RNA polymerase sigma factor (TIGR02999 family)